VIQFSQESIHQIGDEIAELSAQLNAATYRLLVLLRDFDGGQGWSGFRTCAHWLAWRTGMDVGAAREKLRVAHSLAALPQTNEALRRGEVSYTKVRAITRVATPENEGELLELARHGTAAHLEKIVRAWRRISRIEEAEQERERHERRSVRLHIDDDGSYVLRARLDPEVGALLEQALEMAAASLAQGSPPAQRRADALALLVELAHGAQPGRRGSRTNRFEVTLHVDPDALCSTGDAGMCELESGVRVSAETSRRIACDASLVVMAHAAKGEPLGVGRRRRTVPPSLRRALDRRDRGCRFPGCGSRRCDAHHVRHWADGGPTSLENLVLLCRFHHRLVHEEGYTMAIDAAGGTTFVDPYGHEIPEAPPPIAAQGNAVDALRSAHRCDGIEIDAHTAPCWQGRRLDVDLALRALLYSPTSFISRNALVDVATPSRST
jgi:hypothetical protein